MGIVIFESRIYHLFLRVEGVKLKGYRAGRRLMSLTTILLTLKVEEVAINQGMPGASRSWKRHGNTFSLRDSRKDHRSGILILAH